MRSVCSLFLLSLLGPVGSAHSILGLVVDKDTGAPVPETSVFLSSGTAHYSTTSDEHGIFRIDPVLPGTYVVLMQAGESFVSSEDLVIEPPIVEREYKLDLKLPLGKPGSGSVSGRVRAADRPVPFARVALTNESGTHLITTADESGSFNFKNVDFGHYKVVAIPNRPAFPAGDPDSKQVYVSTYFPASLEERDAAIVLVRGDTDVGEIRLQPAFVQSVSGKLFDRAGTPIAGAIVRLYPIVQTSTHIGPSWNLMFRLSAAGETQGPEEFSTVSDDQGAFVLPQVRGGEWLITSEMLIAGKEPQNAERRITVSNQDVENLNLQVISLSPVSGEIGWSTYCVLGRLFCGNRKAPGVALPVRLHFASGAQATRLVVTGPDGAFRTEVPTGARYGVEPVFPMLDGRVVAGSLYQVPPREPADPLLLRFSVTLDDGGQTLFSPTTTSFEISGLSLSRTLPVTVGGRVPGGDGAVIFLPEEPGYAGVVAPLSPDGEFVASGLSGGVYYVAAFRDFGIRNLRSFNLIPHTKRVGKKVRIERGSAMTLDDLYLNNWLY